MTTQVAPEELVSVFATNVRIFREKLKLTQAQLAERLDTYTSYISALENGKKTPWLANLAILAEALETTPDALLKKPKKSA